MGQLNIESILPWIVVIGVVGGSILGLLLRNDEVEFTPQIFRPIEPGAELI